ncbi:hypothetical protein ENBRE01_0820 [Enteropsectra breve]|nr:hypothetical protein ENBRE01_0820 [Enteropsectra breve]
MEQDGDKGSPDEQGLNAPISLMDDNFDALFDDKEPIQDFSANGLEIKCMLPENAAPMSLIGKKVIAFAEHIKYKGKNKQVVAPRSQEPKIGAETDHDLFGDKKARQASMESFDEREMSMNKSTPNDVYMDTILTLFQKLNTKIEGLSNIRQENKRVIDECYSQLLVGNSDAAAEILSIHSTQEQPSENSRLKAISKKWEKSSDRMKAELLEIREKLLKLSTTQHKIADIAVKKSEESERLKNIIYKQSNEHRAQVEQLSKENSILKEGLIAVLRENGESLNSQLEEDLLKTLQSSMARMSNENKRKEELLEEKTAKIGMLEKQLSAGDSEKLNAQIEEYKKTVASVQGQNLNFTQIIQKLSEKNVKLKRDLVLFNTELTKAAASLKNKNEIIARQKTLIDMFQKRISGEFPINELQQKRKELEDRLTNEKDYFAKKILEKEKIDCEKRLADFMGLKKH